MSAKRDETAKRERPILFSGPMVRAILDGKKTQTRRVVKFPDAFIDDGALPDIYHGYGDWGASGRGFRFYVAGTGNLNLASPYGIAGDRLWVRETFGEFRQQPGTPVYRADDAHALGSSNPWRPSIFMPRKYSRLSLEITDVRVERLLAITNADAIAEGCTGGADVDGYSEANPADPYEEYANLWDSLNAKRGYGWDVNPWVWVIEFRPLSERAS